MRTSWYHLCWGLLPWRFCPWARGPSDPGTNCLHHWPLLRFPRWHWSLGSLICSCVWVWSRAWDSGSVTWCVPLRQTIHSGFAEKTGRRAKTFRLSFYQMMGEKKITKPKPEWNKEKQNLGGCTQWKKDFYTPIEMTKSYKQNIKGDKNSACRQCVTRPGSLFPHIKGYCEKRMYTDRLVQCLAHRRCSLPTKC